MEKLKEVDNQEKEQKELNIPKIIIYAVVIVFSLQVAYAMIIYSSINNWADRGTFGDMFGATNAVFSGLAFIGIIFTIFLQKNELKLQREELGLQRAEIRRSTEELAGQKEMMNLQRIESTIFNMIELHNKNVGALNSLLTNNNTSFFARLLSDIKSKAEQRDSNLQKSFSYYCNEETRSELKKYYNFLFYIFTFIHGREDISPSNKQIFMDIINTQLSNEEVIILYLFYYYKENDIAQILNSEYDFFKDVSLDPVFDLLV